MRHNFTDRFSVSTKCPKDLMTDEQKEKVCNTIQTTLFEMLQTTQTVRFERSGNYDTLVAIDIPAHSILTGKAVIYAVLVSLDLNPSKTFLGFSLE